MKSLRSLSLLIWLSLLLPGCGPGQLFGPTPTPTSTVTPTASSTPRPTATFTHTPSPTPVVYDGLWSGKTSAGGTVEFEIRENALLSIRVTFGFSTNKASCNVDANTTISPGLPISGNAFEINIPAIQLAATFDSPTTAAGTLRASEDQQRCRVSVDLTWTAARQ